MDEAHLGLVGSTSTLGIGAVTIAVLAIGILLSNSGIAAGCLRKGLLGLAEGCIEAGDVLLQEGTDGLTDQFGRHLD